MHGRELTRERTRTLDESLLADSEQSDRPVRDFLVSTPGWLALLAVIMIAAVLGIGLFASKTVFDQRDQLQTLRTHTEPLADAAQRIYGALSFANTTAADAFLAGGVEPPDVRDRYDAAIGQASAGLVTASNGVAPNDIHSLTLLTDLSNQLAVYTGVMATARANKRVELPVGVAYLSESSALMQHSVLPAAERLYRTQTDAVVASTRSAIPLRTLIVAGVLILGLLLFAQISLARRSHRRFNLGLLLASLLLTVLVVWLAVAGAVSARASAGARAEGAEPLDSVVTARILTQQARADEILGLLKRGSDPFSDIRFGGRTAQIGWALDEYPVGGAREALDGWMRTHRELVDLLNGGDYPGAVMIARDDAPEHATAQFSRLDTALADESVRLRERQRDGITRAYTALTMLPEGAVAIGVMAALAVVAGIAPRLSEYH